MSEREPDSTESADPVENRELWDKRPDESQKAFDAFVRYRDAEKRSFKAIAGELSCSPQNVFQWSSRYNWKLRCDAFDVDQDRQQREDLARGRVRMRDRHLRLSLAMQGIAAHALAEWQSRIASGAALNLAPEQISMLVKAAVDLEKATVGMQGEHRYTQIIVNVGGQVRRRLRFHARQRAVQGEARARLPHCVGERLRARRMRWLAFS